MKPKYLPLLASIALIGCGQSPSITEGNGPRSEGNSASNRPVSNFSSEASQPIVSNSSPSSVPDAPLTKPNVDSPVSTSQPASRGDRTNASKGATDSIRNAASVARSRNPYGGPADETVRERYSIEGGSTIEIIGVCKVTEEGVTCWDMKGNSLPELAGKITEKYSGPRQYVSGFTIYPGKKSRGIIYTQTQNNSASSSGQTRNANPEFIHVVSAGDPESTGVMAGGSFGYSDNESKTLGSQQVYVMTESRMAVEPMSAKETRVRLQVIESFQDNQTMALKPGATLSANGITYRIQKIFEGRPKTEDPRFQGYQGYTQKGKSWTVEIEVKGTPSDPKVNCSLAPSSDSSASLFGRVDLNGDPIKEQRMPAMIDGRPNKEFFEMRQGYTGSYSVSGNKLIMVLNINPKHVEKLSLQRSKSRFVDIVGIPLDPR